MWFPVGNITPPPEIELQAATTLWAREGGEAKYALACNITSALKISFSVYKSVTDPTPAAPTCQDPQITLTEKSLLGVSRLGKWLKAYGLVQTG